jgi:formate C-acetyltransferase
MEPYFGYSSKRIQSLREELLSTEPQICVQRALLATKSYAEHDAEQMIIKRAMVLSDILSSMDIYIEDQTLLCGNQARGNRFAPIFPEYAMDWVIEELDAFGKRSGDRFFISEEDKQTLRSLAPFWKNRCLKDKGLAALPPHSRMLYDLGFIKSEGNITSGDAHIAVNYQKILSHGLSYYYETAKQAYENLDLSDFTSLKSSYFYRAAMIATKSVMDFSLRYSKLAGEMAEKCTDEHRKTELFELQRITATVLRNPASSFHEALQSVWLIQLVLQIESNGHSLSYGRLDQYCQPYLEKDLAKGIITEEKATELLENLWLKTFSINKIRSWSHTKFSAGSPLYQNVTIGGQTGEGKDATNKLSYLVLKSVARVHLTQPNLTVRYHRNLDDRFLFECLQVVKLGFGMPAFNNDEIIIPSFIEKGVSKEDAFNYSAIGCVEVAVPGKWGYRCTGMSFLNFPKALMTALNGGVDLASGKLLLPQGPHFTQMHSFDEVMTAWDRTVREFARQAVIIDSCADLVLEQEAPDALCSTLTDDCLKRGKSIKEGGAVYDFISGLQVGIANLADSLSVIKMLVFEKKLISQKELWDALANDFTGEEGLRIQKICLYEAPKYGNDDDYVDQLLVQAYGFYIDEMQKYHNTRYNRGPIGGSYYAGTSSISANVPQGASVGATPDGRKAFSPLAEGCSPSHGADIQGPTAVYKSVAKLPTDKITGGVLLNQKINPSLLSKQEDLYKLMVMIRTFFDDLKGFHVQYNVVSRETLIDAQMHPEKHRDLIVRVAGYSAFFNVLSRETQDDIIARTEQPL